MELFLHRQCCSGSTHRAWVPSVPSAWGGYSVSWAFWTLGKVLPFSLFQEISCLNREQARLFDMDIWLQEEKRNPRFWNKTKHIKQLWVCRYLFDSWSVFIWMDSVCQDTQVPHWTNIAEHIAKCFPKELASSFGDMAATIDIFPNVAAFDSYHEKFTDWDLDKTGQSNFHEKLRSSPVSNKAFIKANKLRSWSRLHSCCLTRTVFSWSKNWWNEMCT